MSKFSRANDRITGNAIKSIRRVFYVFYGISQSSFEITFSYKDDFDSNVLYTKTYCFLQIYVRHIATKSSYLYAVS